MSLYICQLCRPIQYVAVREAQMIQELTAKMWLELRDLPLLDNFFQHPKMRTAYIEVSPRPLPRYFLPCGQEPLDTFNWDAQSDLEVISYTRYCMLNFLTLNYSLSGQSHHPVGNRNNATHQNERNINGEGDNSHHRIGIETIKDMVPCIMSLVVFLESGREGTSP